MNRSPAIPRAPLRVPSSLTAAAVLCLTAAFAPGAAAQVRCDSACMDAGGSESTGPSSHTPLPANATAQQILDRMIAQYEERMAGVDNYLVVQTVHFGRGDVDSVAVADDPAADDLPTGIPPALLYHEKAVVDGHTAYKVVPPHELARRENEAMGGIDMAALAEVANAVLAKVETMVDVELGNVDPDVFLNYDDNDDYAAINFWQLNKGTFYDRAERIRTDTIDGMPHAVLYADDLRSGFSDGGDGVFTPESATVWVRADQMNGDAPIVPARMRLEGWTHPKSGAIRRVTLMRRWEGYRWVGPTYEPFRIRDVFSGLGELTGAIGAMKDVNEVLTIVRDLEVNTGPPTQARMAELMASQW